MNETNSPSTSIAPQDPYFNSLKYIVALIFLLLGIIGGYILSILSPSSFQLTSKQQKTAKTLGKTTIPQNAVRIQSCADRRGALYIRPEDVPIGPIYMVYDGEVIGLEYMLAQDDFLKGKPYINLPAHGMQIDHVNTGLIKHGHAGYSQAHYHVDLYRVKPEVEEAIICSKTKMPQEHGGGMNTVQETTAETQIPPYIESAENETHGH